MSEKQAQKEMEDNTSGVGSDSWKNGDEEHSSRVPETSCVICGDDISMQTKAVLEPCAHVFHAVCILQWIGQRNSYPVCRSLVTEVKQNWTIEGEFQSMAIEPNDHDENEEMLLPEGELNQFFDNDIAQMSVDELLHREEEIQEELDRLREEFERRAIGGVTEPEPEGCDSCDEDVFYNEPYPTIGSSDEDTEDESDQPVPEMETSPCSSASTTEIEASDDEDSHQEHCQD